MSDRFVRTDTVLDKILAYKQVEIISRMSQISLQEMRRFAGNATPPRDMLAALRKETVALIAEVKKASPSKGVLIEDFDPVKLGNIYAENGASAISVLTDEEFFQGSLGYLTRVRDSVSIPVLRKDFIITPYQVYEGRMAGADAILLIVAALTDEQLLELHDLIRELGMVALVEVHNVQEMERALKLGAKLIGINNRNLKTFDVDLNITAKLARLVSDDVTLVAESGIMNVKDVREMGKLGAHAVLVGESLVKSDDVARSVREYSSQRR